jgi:hypothetical protein
MVGYPSATFGLVAAAFALAACVGPNETKVALDDHTFIVTREVDSRARVRAGEVITGTRDPVGYKRSQIKAIEMTTGCKVVDTAVVEVYQLYAEIACDR